MRLDFIKLGVLLNQAIRYKITNKLEELEKLEDEVIELLDAYKNEVDKYKQFLL